jgi:hypothetical protein
VIQRAEQGLSLFGPTPDVTHGAKERKTMDKEHTTDAKGEPAVASTALLACAGDAGCVPREDCIMVHLRVPMRVNRFESKAVPLCASCRKAMRGQWKRANTGAERR